jgi:hypothetical protein
MRSHSISASMSSRSEKKSRPGMDLAVPGELVLEPLEHLDIRRVDAA